MAILRPPSDLRSEIVFGLQWDFSQQDLDAMWRHHQHSERYPSIDWTLFSEDVKNGKHAFEAVVDAVSMIDSESPKYLGVTSSPPWRWQECTEAGMTPHSNNFTTMNVLNSGTD